MRWLLVSGRLSKDYFPKLGLVRKFWEKLRTRPAAVLAKALLFYL